MELPNIHIYQIIVVALSAFMIYQGLSNYFSGKNNQTGLKLLVRLLVWGGMASVAAFPNASNTLADMIGMKGNVNAVILTGFIFIFLIIFKLLSAIERLEQSMSEIVRKDSLKDISIEKN